MTPLLLPLLSMLSLGCDGRFSDKGGDPNGSDDTGYEADADTDADADADADADSDTDSDTDTDTADDTGEPDPNDVDDDGDGISENEGDCDDTDASVGPEEDETPYNGIDDDCDEGTPDDDVDGDGFLNADDCDDKAADVNPDAEEVHDDGIDNDCDGETDERFETETVDASCDCGAPSAIDTDTYDRAHIAYHDADSGTVRYVRRKTDGSFNTPSEVVNYSTTGEWLDAEMDAADQFQLAYTAYDSANGWTGLDFVYRDASGSWSSYYEVDGPSNGFYDVGYYVDLEIDSSNLPSFAYFDNEDQEPMLADFTTYGVAIYTDVDINYLSINPTGYYSSLALDSNGEDHVAFWQNGTLFNEVQYAWPLDATFSETVWDDPGYYLSMEMRSDDVPCIAFFDSVNADLVYACRDGGSWATEVVDSPGSVGVGISLDFDSTDTPWIAYYVETSGNLKVATWNGSDWDLIKVDTGGDVGAYPSLAIDSSDVVHISYYDVSNGTLKYATGY